MKPKIYPYVEISPRTKVEMGDDSFIGQFTFISVPLLKLGARSQINGGCHIVGRGRVVIGDDVVVSYGSKIFTSVDQPEGLFMNDARREDERKIVTGDISIEDGAFLGANVVVCVSKRCSNISIGKRAVIGSGLYIDRSVPTNTVVLPHKTYYTKLRSNIVVV